MTYNPQEVVKDGPFAASREWQHVLKIMQGLSLFCLFGPFLGFPSLIAGLLAGPGQLVAIKIAAFSTYGIPEWGDALVDGMLYSVAALLGLWAGGDRALGVALLILFVGAYFRFRPLAHP